MKESLRISHPGGRIIKMPLTGKEVIVRRRPRLVGEVLRRIYPEAFGDKDGLHKELGLLLPQASMAKGKLNKGTISCLTEMWQCDPQDIRRIALPRRFGGLLMESVPPLILEELISLQIFHDGMGDDLLISYKLKKEIESHLESTGINEN